MTPARSADPESVVVARLRAAGCVFAEDEARLLAAAARSPDHLAVMVDRRVAGHPLEQILGWVEFGGLRLAVEPGVFVPRRRTGLLVREAVALVRRTRRTPVVLDLCCGTGAVGAAVARAVHRTDLHAVDVDPCAVRCARRNLDALGRVYEGDLYAPLPEHLRGRVDVVVANAPYVPTDAIATMPPEARLHEPALALDGGVDGLDVQRRVIAGAGPWLAPGGHLLVETSSRQAPAGVEELVRSGFEPRVVRSEHLDATVLVGSQVGSRPAATAGS